MANNDIIPVYKSVIPTVVSYDPENKKLKIGEAAKVDGINNATNMFNFKMDLFLGEKEFTNKKKYWYGVTYSKDKYEHNTFSARQVAGFFISELLKGVDLPERLIVGEPAVREVNLKENFRKNIRDVFADIGFKKIDLFFEPFAVFQHYRHFEKLFPVSEKSEIILVVDVGGGTFNSCIIATTNEGKLSRGGATMLPLGLQGDQCGGSAIDIELAKVIIEKCKCNGIVWKDNPLERAKTPVLFRIEEAKIFLSEKIGSTASINSNFDKHKTKVDLPKGTLHQDISISEYLTGEDLKNVIRNMWRYKYGKIITQTVAEAEEKLKKKIEVIDKVIIAGGSSKLPFMQEEILTVLPTLVNKKNIYIGSDLGNAVACGIACESKELVKSKKYPDLSVGTIAPCLLKDLYVSFKVERRGKLILPLVNSKECNGMLFSSPFEISKVTKSYDIELTADIYDKLYFYFDDKPFTDDDPTYLNVSDNVVAIPTPGKVTRKFRLDLEISENGAVVPTFTLQGKGSEAKKLVKPITSKEFYLDNSNVVEGDGFLGIDFGTSNSYVAKFLCTKPTENETANYPIFTIRHSVHEILRNRQIELQKFYDENILYKEVVLDHARKNKYLMIFHSNKIEGNTLSHGETESILDGEKPENPSKSQMEAINLENAFEWVLENYEDVLSSPESFIRHINKLILNEIKQTAGDYRKCPVKLAGMEYVPPPSTVVTLYMRELTEEISQGIEDRSPIEFAASVHTKLVMIHPFEDGNGRTSRLFMNAILLKYNLPIAIINYADKQRYFDCIISANKGDISDFILYINDCIDSEFDEIKGRGTELKRPVADEENPPHNKNSPIFGSKFNNFLNKRLEEKSRESEDIYNKWSSNFENFKKDIAKLINQFNSSEYTQLGYYMRLKEYDKLTFEKYNDLAKGKNVPRTWYFRIDLSNDTSYEKILFFFQHASSKIKKQPNILPVSLCLARSNGSTHRRLLYEPIQLHEVGTTKDELIYLLQGDKTEKGDVSSVISDFLLLDVFDNYL